MPKGLTDKTKENMAKILFIIKEAPGIHLRGIARTLNMNPFTVSTLIDRYLTPFFDIKVDPYGSRIKVFYVKEGKENTKIEDVLRYYLAKKRIKGNV